MIVYSRNYRKRYFEYEPLLKSIFNQRYSNYRVIFISDALDSLSLLSLYKFIKE
jgi:hypothetical protein